MRVLFTTFPIGSHFFPMVPLAWALRAAGHSVRVACSPGYAQAVASSGLPVLPVGADVDASRIWRGFVPGRVDGRSPDDEAAQRSARALTMFHAVAEAMAEDLLRHGRAWRPDLVVYEPRAYAGLVLADRLRGPAIRHLWGTDYTYERWPTEAPVLQPLLAASGFTADDPFGALTIDPCPPSLQQGQVANRQTIQYVPYNGVGRVPLWLDEPPARPRVCLTWGTSPLAAGQLDAFLRLLDGLAGLELEVMLTVTRAERLRDRLPAGVRVLEAMPLHLLLPTCSVLVHQGGAGTTLTGIARGVPQYILPAIADGTLHGGLLSRCGAALTDSLAELRPKEFRAGIEALVHEPGFRAATEKLRQEMTAQPAPAAVVAALEGWG